MRGFNFHYGKFHALKNIDLDIRRHCVTTFIGPSGCGKSTLLRAFNRMYALYPDQHATGRILFDGADVTSIPAAGARNVRVLFSDPGVLADDVIRSLVLAEPQGRPLVVATSDQAVVNSVCAAGSYAIPAAVLLARLGRV